MLCPVAVMREGSITIYIVSETHCIMLCHIISQALYIILCHVAVMREGSITTYIVSELCHIIS